MSGYVYAIQFDDLAIKVGRADDAIKRIARHQTEATRHGRHIVRVWSARVGDPAGTEGHLIDFCLSHGTARAETREYFTGVPWDSCLAMAELLSRAGRLSRGTSQQVSRGTSQQVSQIIEWLAQDGTLTGRMIGERLGLSEASGRRLKAKALAAKG